MHWLVRKQHILKTIKLFVCMLMLALVIQSSQQLTNLVAHAQTISSDNDEAMYVAESNGLLKVFTQSGIIEFELESESAIIVAALSPNGNSIWLLTQNSRLDQYDLGGKLLSSREIVLSDDALSKNTDPEAFVFDAQKTKDLVVTSNTIWLSTSTQLYQLNFVDSTRSIAAEVQLSDTPTNPSYFGLRYDSKRDRIWLGVADNSVNKKLLALDSAARVVESIDASPATISAFAYDKSIDQLWLLSRLPTGGLSVQRYDHRGQLVFSNNDIPNDQWLLASPDSSGGLWLGSLTEIAYINSRGDFEFQLPAFSDLEDQKLVDMIAGSSDQSVWVANQTILKQFGVLGDVLKTLSPDLGDGKIRQINRLSLQTQEESITEGSNIDVTSDKNTDASGTLSGSNGVQSESSISKSTQNQQIPQSTVAERIDSSAKESLNASAIGQRTAAIVPVLALLLLDDTDTDTDADADADADAPTDANPITPPTIESTPITTARVDVLYQYQVQANDVNDEAIEYSLRVHPNGIDIDPSTGLIQWLPQEVGVFDISVAAVNESGAQTEQNFTITVTENQAPSITSTPITQAEVDADYSYAIIASDPDDQTLTYRLIERPNGLSVDEQTGLVSWQPFELGEFTVTVEVSDPQGLSASQTYQILVEPTEDDMPPVLNQIGNIVAPLGQTTERTIQATDPEGETISYSISPLPLPQGMSFAVSTGEFEYRPALSDIGNKVFTISASDGRFTSSEVVTVTVPEPQGETSFSGQVLFPDGSPLPGVRIAILGQESVSDASGNFSVRNIPQGGRQMFFIDSSGVDPTLGTFASIPEQFDFVAGTDNHLFAPIFLEPIDLASADDVDPFQESVITSSDVIIDGVNYGPVTMTIAPRTGMDDETGEFFDRQIAISRIPDVNLGPTPMPDDIELSVYISVQPFGVTYTEPAEVSFPNVENFPAGTIVDIFGLNHETGAFEFTGEAEVSADGRTVDSIGGAVFANSWHGFVPRDPEPEPENDDCDCEGDKPANSSFGLKTGNFKDYYQTPSYYSVGQARSVGLVYNSKWASANPILNFDTAAGLPPPVAMSQSLLIGGIQTPEVFLQPDSFGSVIGGAIAKNAVQFDASEFESGVYPYEFTISCQFPISRRSGSAEGQTVIINESNSPYGAGWSVADLRRLHVSQDRQFVAMDLANGNFWRFTRNPDGTYEAPPGHFSELFENTNGTFRLVTKSGTQYNFDLQGLLTSVSDRNNNETTYTYDNLERLTVITDPVGLQTRFTYIGEKLNRITDPSSRFVEFEHDSEGNLVRIKDPDNTEINYSYEPNTHLRTQKISKRGFVSTVSYDQFGRYQSVVLPDSSVRTGRNQDTQGLPDLRENSGTENDLAPPPPNTDEVESGYVDANGNFKRFQYDNDGYLMNTTDAVGRATEIERDLDKNPTMTLRPNGSVVRNTYDDNGNVLTSLEEFNGALTTYTYDQFSLVTSMVDALNRRTTMGRDSRGNLTRSENAEGHVSTMDYNVRGQVTRMEDPNGLVTEYEYDQNFLMVRKVETPPVGNVRVTTTQYNAIGLPESMTTPDGITQIYEYDGLNRPIRMQNQLGEAQTTVYDEYGNVIESRALNIDGSTAIQETREYDERDRLITVIRPHENGEQSITRQEYDANSNVTRTTDPDGKVTRYFYDGENRTISMTQPDGGVVQYTYDTRDQLVSVTAGNGATTTYEYDVLTRKLAENSPDRGRWTWDYNVVDQVTRQTDERGITTDFAYDLLDRPLTKTFPTASENVTYTYDNCSAGIGRLCERTDDSGNHTYNYDFFGNVLQMSRTELGILYTESYVYDDGDNVIQCTYPTGRTVDFARDGIRRTNGITSNGSQLINSMAYRGDSQMIGRSWSNGIQETRTYDQQARVTQIALSNIGNRNYSYDASSNITSISSPNHNGLYDYDLNDRLTQEVLNTPQVNTNQADYNYDFNGNRLSRLIDQGLGNETYQYSPNSNQLQQTDAVMPDGTNTQVNNKTLAHNDADRIRSIMIDDQVVGEYFYNDMGLRSRKTITNDSGELETTVYHYNMVGSLIAETSDTGQTQVEYIWNGMEPVAQIDQSGTTSLHSDHLYTPRLGTDELQSTVWQWESDAFGSTTPQIESKEVNLRFPGQYADAETGLHYNWNRYYDAGLGRYVTSDPIGLQGGMNTYTYVNNRPLVYLDDEGLCPSTIDTGWFNSIIYKGSDYNNGKRCNSYSQEKRRHYGTLRPSGPSCDKDQCSAEEKIVRCSYFLNMDWSNRNKPCGATKWSPWISPVRSEFVVDLDYNCQTQEFDDGLGKNNTGTIIPLR